MKKFWISFEHGGKEYKGWINPIDQTIPPCVFQVILNNTFMGMLAYNSGWRLDLHPELSEILGKYVVRWWASDSYIIVVPNSK